MLLDIKNLKARVKEDKKEILKGINLSIDSGEIHVIMGPNGSGKSTLANVIMGNPKYEVTEGDILFEGRSIMNLSTDKRAKLGIFLAFQNPLEIPGVKFSQFLVSAYRNLHGEDKTIFELNKEIQEVIHEVSLEENHINRYINVGFSGGEKKKGEILQARFLKPKLVILDEIDSGLDVDSVKLVSLMIEKMAEEGIAFIVITHYKRLLNFIKPNIVHVYIDGRIVESDGVELADLIEKKGYSIVKEVKYDEKQIDNK